MQIEQEEFQLMIPDVVLFLKYSFHRSTLEPVFKELQKLEVIAELESRRHVVYDTFNTTGRKFPVFVNIPMCVDRVAPEREEPSIFFSTH
jgi:hypothetical protein